MKLIEKLQDDKLSRAREDNSGVEEVIQSIRRDLSFADAEAAEARDDSAARLQVEQSEPESIRCMRREVENASNAHKDLLSKQNALDTKLDEMAKHEIDEGVIGELAEIEFQFQEFVSMRKRMVEDLRDMDDKIGRLRQRKKNKLHQRAVEELLDMTNEESYILKDIEKNNVMTLSKIEMCKQVATASMGNPRCRTM